MQGSGFGLQVLDGSQVAGSRAHGKVRSVEHIGSTLPLSQPRIGRQLSHLAGANLEEPISKGYSVHVRHQLTLSLSYIRIHFKQKWLYTTMN